MARMNLTITVKLMLSLCLLLISLNDNNNGLISSFKTYQFVNHFVNNRNSNIESSTLSPLLMSHSSYTSYVSIPLHDKDKKRERNILVKNSETATIKELKSWKDKEYYSDEKIQELFLQGIILPLPTDTSTTTTSRKNKNGINEEEEEGDGTLLEIDVDDFQLQLEQSSSSSSSIRLEGGENEMSTHNFDDDSTANYFEFDNDFSTNQKMNFSQKKKDKTGYLNLPKKESMKVPSSPSLLSRSGVTSYINIGTKIDPVYLKSSQQKYLQDLAVGGISVESLIDKGHAYKDLALLQSAERRSNRANDIANRVNDNYRMSSPVWQKWTNKTTETNTTSLTQVMAEYFQTQSIGDIGGKNSEYVPKRGYPGTLAPGEKFKDNDPVDSLPKRLLHPWPSLQEINFHGRMPVSHPMIPPPVLWFGLNNMYTQNYTDWQVKLMKQDDTIVGGNMMTPKDAILISRNLKKYALAKQDPHNTDSAAAVAVADSITTTTDAAVVVVDDNNIENHLGSSSLNTIRINENDSGITRTQANAINHLFGESYDASQQLPHGGSIFYTGHKIPYYHPDHGPTVSILEAEPPIPVELLPLTERWYDPVMEQEKALLLAQNIKFSHGHVSGENEDENRNIESEKREENIRKLIFEKLLSLNQSTTATTTATTTSTSTSKEEKEEEEKMNKLFNDSFSSSSSSSIHSTANLVVDLSNPEEYQHFLEIMTADEREGLKLQREILERYAEIKEMQLNKIKDLTAPEEEEGVSGDLDGRGEYLDEIEEISFTSVLGGYNSGGSGRSSSQESDASVIRSLSSSSSGTGGMTNTGSVSSKKKVTAAISSMNITPVAVAAVAVDTDSTNITNSNGDDTSSESDSDSSSSIPTPVTVTVTTAVQPGDDEWMRQAKGEIEVERNIMNAALGNVRSSKKLLKYTVEFMRDLKRDLDRGEVQSQLNIGVRKRGGKRRKPKKLTDDEDDADNMIERVSSGDTDDSNLSKDSLDDIELMNDSVINAMTVGATGGAVGSRPNSDVTSDTATTLASKDGSMLSLSESDVDVQELAGLGLGLDTQIDYGSNDNDSINDDNE